MSRQPIRIALDRTPPTWVLLALSGLMLGMAYPPNPVGLLGSIGLVPLLVAIERAGSYKQLFRWSYSSLLIFSALSSYWVGSWQAKADPFLMISCILLIIIHPFFFIVPLFLYRFVRLRTSRLFALAFLPFLWCGGEYLHALSDASYPWLTLGNTQTYNIYFIQFIEFTGVWGLSFLLLVQNSVIAAMIFAFGRPALEQARALRIGALILALTLVPPFLYGVYVLGGAGSHIPEKGLTVTVVQPNVDPWDKWKSNGEGEDQIRLNADISMKSLKDNPTQMFLWSETAIPYPVSQPGFEGRRDELRAVIDSLGVPVLTGFPDYMEYSDRATAPPSSHSFIRPGPTGADTIRFDNFNSAGLFLPGIGLKDAAYHKMQLVPFGERIPFIDNFPALMNMLSWGVGISTWGQGDRITTFAVPVNGGVAHAASVICFESVYPNVVRKFVDSGANFLTIITNDGWYRGTPGPRQHERFAIMRAIETRRAIARSANTGISCFVSPYGTISNETQEGIATATTATIELRDDKTLYVRWGDWWPKLCLALAAGMFIYAMTRKKPVPSTTIEA